MIEHSRNPTFSYTQRLEARIFELENQLKQSSKDEDHDDLSRADSTHEKLEDEVLPASAFEGLRMDDPGKISYHGPTSILNVPLRSVRCDEDTAFTTLPDENGRAEEWREQLVANALEQRVAEVLSSDAVGVIVETLLRLRMSPDRAQTPFQFTLQYLLDFHWTWIQPLFNFVYRPAFTRMTTVSMTMYLLV